MFHSESIVWTARHSQGCNVFTQRVDAWLEEIWDTCAPDCGRVHLGKRTGDLQGVHQSNCFLFRNSFSKDTVHLKQNQQQGLEKATVLSYRINMTNSIIEMVLYR